MKYVHKDFIGVKHYYISNGWSGRTEVKEYRNGTFATKIELDGPQAQQFLRRLQENGWYADESRSDRSDSRGGTEVSSKESKHKETRKIPATRSRGRAPVVRRTAVR